MYGTKKINKHLLFLLVILPLLILSPNRVLAQDGWGRVSYEKAEVDEIETFRPYVVFCVGAGDPIDEAYAEAFNNKYMRYGGGFGLRFNNFGAELYFRSGVVDRSKSIKRNMEPDVNRNFHLSSNDIQLRLYNAPKIGSFNIPVGFSTGVTLMKADGGEVGISDKVGGSGFYFSPFIGIEKQVNKYFTFSVEGEYALSKIKFDSQPANSVQEMPKEAWMNDDGTSFWDNIGGTEKLTFDNSGFTINFKLKFFIPRYTAKEGS